MRKISSKSRGLTPLGKGIVGIILLLTLIGGCSRNPKTETPSRSMSAAVETFTAEPTAAPTFTPEPTPTPEPTETPEPTPTPYLIHWHDPDMTVYVSKKGVIHFRSDCSGMKYFTEMTLEAADVAGYKYCEHCA